LEAVVLKNWSGFLRSGIWRIRERELPPGKALAVKGLRTFLLALRRFGEDQNRLWASALTFYTLLAVVPVLAMIFGVAKGFGLEEHLQKLLLDKLQGQEETVGRLIAFSHNLLENTRGGLIAGIGVIMLLWTVINVLGDIESSFNAIWGVRKGRSLGRKFSDYLALMLVCPLLLVTSGGITVAVSSQVKLVLLKIPFVANLGPFVFLTLKLLPYVFLWVLFSLVYSFMPNTKVRWSSALVAGITAGTAVQITQWIYINFQVGVAKYNAIYGSFAALPLFLAWLQLSWTITLFGAQVSYAWQTEEEHEFETESRQASGAARKLLTLRFMQAVLSRFLEEAKPLTAREIGRSLGIPPMLNRRIVEDLCRAELITATAVENGEPGWQPARDPDLYTVRYVLDALDRTGTMEVPALDDAPLGKLRESLDRLDRAIIASDANVRLKEIK
jgi:membrane protein